MRVQIKLRGQKQNPYIYGQQWSQHSNGERKIFSANGTGQLSSHLEESEVGLLPDTIYKNEIKMGVQPKCES